MEKGFKFRLGKKLEKKEDLVIGKYYYFFI